MISTNKFKNGMAIEVDNQFYLILEFQHVKSGRGGAFVRTKLKNLTKGLAIINRTFRAGEKFKQIFLEEKKLQYLFRDKDTYYFLDNQTYEQIGVDASVIGEDNIRFLKENDQAIATFYQDKLIRIALPIFVKLKVRRAEPGFRGDTARSGSKPVQLETGTTIQVPLFINTEDTIKIDTRSGKYVERL